MEGGGGQDHNSDAAKHDCSCLVHKQMGVRTGLGKGGSLLGFGSAGTRSEHFLAQSQGASTVCCSSHVIWPLPCIGELITGPPKQSLEPPGPGQVMVPPEE